MSKPQSRGNLSIDKLSLVYYHRCIMMEFARALGFVTNEEIPVFASPIESFEYGLSEVLKAKIERFDIVVVAQHGEDWQVYIPNMDIPQGHAFSPKAIEFELNTFIDLHRDPEENPPPREINPRLLYWETPLREGAIVGKYKAYDREGNWKSDTYCIGKPYSERNLRPGQRIHRAISRVIFHAR